MYNNKHNVPLFKGELQCVLKAIQQNSIAINNKSWINSCIIGSGTLQGHRHTKISKGTTT